MLEIFPLSSQYFRDSDIIFDHFFSMYNLYRFSLELVIGYTFRKVFVEDIFFRSMTCFSLQHLKIWDIKCKEIRIIELTQKDSWWHLQLKYHLTENRFLHISCILSIPVDKKIRNSTSTDNSHSIFSGFYCTDCGGIFISSSTMCICHFRELDKKDTF